MKHPLLPPDAATGDEERKEGNVSIKAILTNGTK